MFKMKLPDDVREFVLEVQVQKKVEKGVGFFSIEKTIIWLLRQSMEHTGFQIKKKELGKSDG